MENGEEITVAQNDFIMKLRDGCVISWDGTNI